MMKIEGSGSISQRHGSADPDPDPHQNVMDPQHCLQATSSQRIQENSRQINDLLIFAQAMPRHVDLPSPLSGRKTIGGNSGDSTALSGLSSGSATSDASPDVGGGVAPATSYKNMQLSLMSVQKQLTALKSLAERNSQALQAKEAKVAALEATSRQLALLLLTEANLTLCADTAAGGG
jgi:hypothetical protein